MGKLGAIFVIIYHSESVICNIHNLNPWFKKKSVLLWQWFLTFSIFTSLYCISLVCVLSCSVMSSSLGAHTVCSLPGSSVHGDSPGKNTGVDCHALLQGIFPTQGSNPGLPHCRQILYCLSHQGNPYISYINTYIHMCFCGLLPYINLK